MLDLAPALCRLEHYEYGRRGLNSRLGGVSNRLDESEHIDDSVFDQPYDGIDILDGWDHSSDMLPLVAAHPAVQACMYRLEL